MENLEQTEKVNEGATQEAEAMQQAAPLEAAAVEGEGNGQAQNDIESYSEAINKAVEKAVAEAIKNRLGEMKAPQKTNIRETDPFVTGLFK